MQKEIDANNRRGIVWFEDERVAEWKAEGGQKAHMQFAGREVKYEEAFSGALRGTEEAS